MILQDVIVLTALQLRGQLLVVCWFSYCEPEPGQAGLSARCVPRVQVQLKGHRSVGGMRASIYNSMPVEGIHQLVDFMKEFKATHQQAHWTQPM